jgi:hypothetical protein
MVDYGDLDKKGADEPDPAYMHHCREYRLRNDSSAGDQLNGSITLEESDLKAVGADPGDPVKVYAEANGRWILYERDTYSDRAGVGLPKSHREKLNLSPENRTIEIWLDEAEADSDEPFSESNEVIKQASLTGEETQDREYVLIPDDSPVTYHHVASSDENETECGIDFEGQEHRRFSDPGDALDQCRDCAVRSSDDMTNKELVEWLGEQAGFVATESTPAYLSKGQLVALRDYILDLQDQVEESEEEAVSVGLSKRTAFGQS